MADREQSEQSDQAPSSETTAFGNRPAAGARVLHQAQPQPGTFGGMEAADFLGLSQELAGFGAAAVEETGTPSALPAESPAAADADNSASWLLSLDEQRHPIEAGAEPDIPVEDPAVPERRSFGFGSLAAAALIIGAAIVVAMKFGVGKDSIPPPEPIAKTQPGTTHKGTTKREPPAGPTSSTVTDAQTSIRAEPTPNASEPTAEVVPEPEPTAVSESSPPGPIPVADPVPVANFPRASEQRLAEWLTGRGWARGESAISDPSALDPDSAEGVARAPVPIFLTLVTGPIGALPAADPAETTPYRPGRASSDGELVPSTTAVIAEAPASRYETREGASASPPVGNLRLATEADLAGIWNGDVIPFDALGGSSRLLTPAIGGVRVVMKTGEIFEGRLYAIGQGQVWLESDLGRLALSGQRVQNIDVAAAGDTKRLESLPRMRVRTPGGLFFGKVVARDEQRVTLLTEDGARIILESSDIEPAPLAETRVIGPVGP